jgi:hypothetical protein
MGLPNAPACTTSDTLVTVLGSANNVNRVGSRLPCLALAWLVAVGDGCGSSAPLEVRDGGDSDVMGVAMPATGNHPFDVCLNGSGCADGYQCFCGICTKACSAPQECSRLGAGATCPATVPLTSACREPLNLGCVIPCVGDGDCTALGLGATAVCTAGWCRRPLLVTMSNGAVVSCADRAAAMKATIDPLVADADRSCTTDADCARAYLGNACFGDGCSGVYVSQASAMALSAQQMKLQDQNCDASFKAGCVGPGLTHCPLRGFPVCVAGLCQDSIHGIPP